MYTTTLGELGAQLPVGTVKGKTLDKGFTLRPFKSRVERQLGLWEEAQGDTTPMGQLLAMKVAKLLSLLVSEHTGTALATGEDGMGLAESELAVHRWPMSDVLYIYLFARVQSLGKDLDYPVSCPVQRCGFRTDRAVFDLTTVEVRVADSPDDLFVWVPLKRPFLLRDGKTTLNQVRLEPIRWAAMARPGVLGGPMSQVALATLQDSICAINGADQEYRLAPTEVDELEKIDRVRINRAANKVAAGLDLETNLDCPKCGAKIVNPLNWTYDYFFDASVPLEI